MLSCGHRLRDLSWSPAVTLASEVAFAYTSGCIEDNMLKAVSNNGSKDEPFYSSQSNKHNVLKFTRIHIIKNAYYVFSIMGHAFNYFQQLVRICKSTLVNTW